MATPGDEKFRIWDAYWHDSRIHSAGVDSDPMIVDALQQQWVELGRTLAAGTRVLDLACGNGAAGLGLLAGAREQGAAITVTGVDSAAIDPPRFVPDHAEALGRIAFRPLTRMESLPFPSESFEVVISQFGIEYGNVRECLSEAIRVLVAGGKLVMMALPARSAVVHAARRNLKQSRRLLRGGELFELGISTVQNLSAAEAALPGGDHGALLKPFNDAVEKIIREFGAEECEVVLAVILGLQKVFIDRRKTSLEDQVIAVQTLRTRLAEYAARAQALTRAALSDADLEDVKRNTAASGFRLTEVKPILAGSYGSIAWRMTAERPVDAAAA